MKISNIFFLSLTFIFLKSIFAQPEDFYILSLQTYSGGDQSAFPIIIPGNSTNNSITIEFDVDANYAPNLSIVFKLCDKNWNPYENLFLQNRGYNTEYNLWLQPLPTSIRGARYHYKGSFPNENITFPFPGKWKYEIVLPYDNEYIYGEGKFYVAEEGVRMTARLRRSSLDDNSVPNELNRTFTLNVGFTVPDSLESQRIKMIEVIENRKFEYPVIVNNGDTGERRYFEWNGTDQFNFIIRDLFPGNEYRQTDLRDKNKFLPPTTYAHIDRIEESRYFTEGFRDLDGGFKLTDFKDDYADYMNVVFQLRYAENIYRDVFIVGSFTDWEVLPDYQLSTGGDIPEITIELKRGVYDYQYVTGRVKNGKVVDIDWYKLEGNFWSTKNDYEIFLYYDTPDKGGYDKIIGHVKISSGKI